MNDKKFEVIRTLRQKIQELDDLLVRWNEVKDKLPPNRNYHRHDQIAFPLEGFPEFMIEKIKTEAMKDIAVQLSQLRQEYESL